MRIKSLLWVAIALLFTGIDIPLLIPDFLPDLVGYIILFVCFSMLASYERYFSLARVMTVPLMLAGVANLLNLVTNGSLFIFLSLVCTFLDLLMYYFTFSALARLADSFEQSDLRRPIDSSFIFYTAATVLPLIGELMPDIVPLFILIIVFLVLYVCNIIIRCYRQILLPVEVPPEPEEESAEPESSEE
ncbi:MAG: hypothetical protein LBR85_05430 [Oscillospiraceae bacterium]|nr:hypothetical protein [Oscillospiraceae bacterium]